MIQECYKDVTTRVRSKVGMMAHFECMEQLAVVRPALTYGLEAALLKKLDVTEIKMLRWMVGVTRRDRIRNDSIRGTMEVVEISKTIQEARLRWFGHLRRRAGEYHAGREDMEMEGMSEVHRGINTCTKRSGHVDN
ncbi:uncharacterized protein LOC119575562 [Penaeus monodon]|uniref:uncharacterized protein LOC119575562 n=1 Tax=Penaeus monodon TaxID=6687 RepID=UPI0018A79AEF|nr:uncharacterized protein LOC119575562 [Penaeus monodon]